MVSDKWARHSGEMQPLTQTLMLTGLAAGFPLTFPPSPLVRNVGSGRGTRTGHWLVAGVTRGADMPLRCRTVWHGHRKASKVMVWRHTCLRCILVLLKIHLVLIPFPDLEVVGP